MKNALLIFIFFLIGFGFIFISSYIKTPKQTPKIIHTPVGTEKDFDIANPPKNSQKGIIETLSGDVEFESRTATQPSSIKNPIPLQQGERIVTKKNGNVQLSFNEIGEIHIKPESELSIIQTLPTHVVFQQPKGTIDYMNTQESSLSVRALHTLTVLTNATATISVDEETHIITFTVNKGSAKIAYNNADNVTTVIDLSHGDAYVFNDDDREGRKL